MKKRILKYWMIDLLVSFVLYIAYRIAIMDISADGDGFLATVQYIFDIMLNLGFSLLCLAATVLCSLTVFLNLIGKVRDRSLLSWLSFSGVPLLLTVLLSASLWADKHQYNGRIMTRLLLFSVLYSGITTVLFLRFRKQYLLQNNIDRTAPDTGI